MTGIPGVSWARCENQFHVSCKAAEENHFCVGTESASVTVGQLIQRNGRAKCGTPWAYTPSKIGTARSSSGQWCSIPTGRGFNEPDRAWMQSGSRHSVTTLMSEWVNSNLGRPTANGVKVFFTGRVRARQMDQNDYR